MVASRAIALAVLKVLVPLGKIALQARCLTLDLTGSKSGGYLRPRRAVSQVVGDVCAGRGCWERRPRSLEEPALF